MKNSNSNNSNNNTLSRAPRTNASTASLRVNPDLSRPRKSRCGLIDPVSDETSGIALPIKNSFVSQSTAGIVSCPENKNESVLKFGLEEFPCEVFCRFTRKQIRRNLEAEFVYEKVNETSPTHFHLKFCNSEFIVNEPFLVLS